jgi:hypothetical protein
VLESRNSVPIRLPAGAEFAALDTLSLSGYIVGLEDLIPQCPRLRVLRLDVPDEDDLAAIHSPSLHELSVFSTGCTHRVDIVAPMLRRLSMSLRPYQHVNISMLAPMVESIWWHCSYHYVRVATGFGHWRLDEVTLQPARRQGEIASLHIHASNVCVYPLLEKLP